MYVTLERFDGTAVQIWISSKKKLRVRAEAERPLALQIEDMRRS